MALIKPTEFLLALPFGLRSWRGLLIALVLAGVLFPLWFDWLVAMRNMQGFSLLRGMWAWPALSIPLVACVLEDAAYSGGDRRLTHRAGTLVLERRDHRRDPPRGATRRRVEGPVSRRSATV